MIDASKIILEAWVREVKSQNEFQVLPDTLETIYHAPENYEGIPITETLIKQANLLKKYGVRKSLHNDWWVYVVYPHGYDNIAVAIACLKFVHELQLLMVGLGDPITFKK